MSAPLTAAEVLATHAAVDLECSFADATEIAHLVTLYGTVERAISALGWENPRSVLVARYADALRYAADPEYHAGALILEAETAEHAAAKCEREADYRRRCPPTQDNLRLLRVNTDMAASYRAGALMARAKARSLMATVAA